MSAIITSILLWAGSLFVLLAAVGLLRLPDFFTRMHSGAKAGSLGIAFLACAVAVHAATLEVAFQAILIILFFLLTAPVSMHMIGRAAYHARVPLWEHTVCDELAHTLTETPAEDAPQENPPVEAPPQQG